MPATQTSIHVDPKWYQVMSAIRGCDYTSTGPISHCMSTVKELVTTRIRFIVFNVDYLYGADIENEKMTDAETLRLIAALDSLMSLPEDDLTKEDAYNLYHYIHHMYLAMSAEHVQKHEVWGGNGTQVYRALSECSSRLTDKWR